MLGAELLDSVGLSASILTSTLLTRLAMSSLVRSRPDNDSEELGQPNGFRGPSAIRGRSLQSKSGQRTSRRWGDFATASNLSVRALEEGFADALVFHR